MSRAQTLVLALLVLHLLLGALSLVVARGEHKSPALRWWGWGLLVYSAGLMVTMASPLLTRAIAFTLGNTLIAVAPVLCAAGVFSHTRSRLRWSWVGAGIAATFAVLAVNNFGGYQHVLGNLAVPSAMAVVMFLVAAAVLLRDGPRDARTANQFLAAMLVLAVATWVARIVVMVGALGGGNDAQALDTVVSLFAIAQMVSGVAATLALFWIDVRLMQAELSRVAHSDPLTGLPNRRAILLRFQEEASRAARHGQKFALAIFDLDHFKQVNDRHGHAVGDEVLKAAASAFAAAKRSEDILARIGGEEFLVVFSSQQSIEGALEACERLRDAMAAIEIRFGGDDVRLTVSGGVALYPDDGADWDSLFRAADRRLYAAKDAGRNRSVGKELAASEAPA
jgi:diguanylate cyclase (GGDEF)-like protein